MSSVDSGKWDWDSICWITLWFSKCYIYYGEDWLELALISGLGAAVISYSY